MDNILPPSIKFDTDKRVKSFSADSDKIYTVNLYKLTCDCADFVDSRRENYELSDIRRMCKHLMSEYEKCIGLSELSNLNRFIIGSGHAMKSNFQAIDVPNYYPITATFNTKGGWWNIFVSGGNNEIKSYGFSPTEKRWAYDEKPKGIATYLRNYIISEMQQENAERTAEYQNSKKLEEQAANKNMGCFVIAFLVIFTILYFLFFR